jgi:uncharacterized protein (UPF0332 family)
MKPRDFLSLAEALQSAPDATEASQRTAASRAYYCVFHSVQSKRGDKFADPVHSQAEEFVYDKWGEGMGRRYGRLRDLRGLADYDLETTFSKDKAGSVVQRSKDFLSAISA